MPIISFKRLSAANTPNKNEEDESDTGEKRNLQDDDNINIDDNPYEVISYILIYLQSDCNEDINDIIKYQHQILKQYLMKGTLQYFDVPLLHQLVNN